MDTSKLLEGLLDSLAEKSVKDTDHEERKKTDKTAYGCIREFFDLPEDIKYWQQYYQTAKRNTNGNN